MSNWLCSIIRAYLANLSLFQANEHLVHPSQNSKSKLLWSNLIGCFFLVFAWSATIESFKTMKNLLTNIWQLTTLIFGTKSSFWLLTTLWYFECITFELKVWWGCVLRMCQLSWDVRVDLLSFYFVIAKRVVCDNY